MRQESGELVEKGMVRYIYIILDCSDAMEDNDVKPSRRAVALEILSNFIRDVFEQNPISHVGLITTHHSKAEKITPLSGWLCLLLI
jgi:transcription initiation factor TFIIH subunit 2